MCGIAGCFGKSDKQTISKMISAMEHRGPDDNGIYTCSHATLGHTRLSIVDVAGGHQPLTGENGETALVCNGEIYNFLELRELLKPSHVFSSSSDSETIIHCYEQYGAGCVQKLDGMFAFALINKTDVNVLVLARDPLGIKPLYYGYKNRFLYFSSELGAMSIAGVEKAYEFPEGHYYTPREGFVRYYHIPPARKNNPIRDIEYAARAVRDTFFKSVQKRLLSDPRIHVGSFCSGGLDSSLVAAAAAQHIPNLHTFVVGTVNEKGEESDDLKAARIVSDHIGSQHHEKRITEEEYYKVLPTVIKHLESYDPSLVRCAVPCYFTCELAARHVTVALTGEGADEIFNGYHYMKHLKMHRRNEEARRCLANLHNINLQRTDRMGMKFSLELRVPFLDTKMVELAMLIPAEMKTRQHNGKNVEKWILRKAFNNTGLLPQSILWRYKVQYAQGAGVEDLGEKLAEEKISDKQFDRIKECFPNATINSKEAAYYFTIFRNFHSQDSILPCVGIWTGFDFPEERQKLKGTIKT